MNRRFQTIVALLYCVLSSTAGFTQSGGVITGRVFDQTEAVIPGVTVELLSTGGQDHIETITDGQGNYRFDNAPPGRAQVTFRLINFATVRRELTIVAGSAVTADAVLNVASSADITITAPMTFRNLAELDRPAENLVGVANA